MPQRTILLERPLDLMGTLGPLRRGSGDPTIRLAPGAFERAAMTPDGPATISLRVAGAEVRAEAWGAGADRAQAGGPGRAAVVVVAGARDRAAARRAPATSRPGRRPTRAPGRAGARDRRRRRRRHGAGRAPARIRGNRALDGRGGHVASVGR